MARQMHLDLASRDQRIYAAFMEQRPSVSTDKAACERIADEYALSAKRIGVIVRKQRGGAVVAKNAATESADGMDILVDALKRENDALRAKLLPQPDKHGRVKVPLPKIETYVFTGDIPAIPLPRFTGQWHLDFDECMIAGDFHLPSCKMGYIQKMCALAERHMKPGKRILLDCGDILNGDKDSRHEPLAPQITRSQEFDLVKGVVDYLLGTFDEIYMIPGNHMRKRFMGRLEQDMSYEQLTVLLTSHPRRVHISPYDIYHLRTGGDDWTITHQYQYSKNKLIKANQLAQKYQTNIVTFHQHHTAIGRDEWDRYTIVDCGGFHDSSMMAYVSLVPNTMPAMNNSFIYMRNGTARVMSHYRGITDWSLWLPEDDDKEPKTNNPVIPFRPDSEVEDGEEQAA